MSYSIERQKIEDNSLFSHYESYMLFREIKQLEDNKRLAAVSKTKPVEFTEDEYLKHKRRCISRSRPDLILTEEEFGIVKGASWMDRLLFSSVPIIDFYTPPKGVYMIYHSETAEYIGKNIMEELKLKYNKKYNEI